jgi:glycosyltransferase involved in cell wall biosynthesis
LQAHGEDVHFLIMGYPNVERYQALAHHLGVAGRVTFTGKVAYDDAPRLLALGDVAVSAKQSRTEGSGKLLNYMALAQPVVAYDTPVQREYLGEWGIYPAAGDVVALATALRKIVAAGPAYRRELGAKLRERARVQYDWRQSAEKIAALYDTLSAAAGRAPATPPAAPATPPRR